MRRAALLVTCLSLVLLALLPLTAAGASQQIMPLEYEGRWEGTLVVTNPDGSTVQFPATIELTGGGVGSVVGTVEYPAGPVRTYRCAGDLVLQNITGDGRRLEFVEKLTDGQAYCTFYDAVITLTLQADETLAYQWTHPGFGGSVTAIFTRAGAPPATTGSTSQQQTTAREVMPAAFAGRWEGTINNIDANGQPVQYPATIDLPGGSVGAVVGTGRVPQCAADWRLQNVSSDGHRLELAEKITAGQDYCALTDATVTLTLQDDGSLAYRWTHPSFSGIGTGIFTRVGAPPVTTGGPLDTLDTSCQATEIATLANMSTLAGPFYGTLEQGTGMITLVNAETTADAFLASATFTNPTDGSSVPWDYGFAFHEAPDRGAVQQVFLASPGTWYYASYPSGAQQSGPVPNFDARPGGVNTLDVLVAEGTASLCVNGQYVDTAALPPAIPSDVYVATGFLDQTMVDGRVMGYRDFEVWDVPATIAQEQPASACDWTGTWDTPYGPLRLTQDSGTVSGDYDWDQGQMSGTISGWMLSGGWNEMPTRQPPSDAGEFRFTMAENCQAFTGIWRYGSTGEWLTGWSGERRSG